MKVEDILTQFKVLLVNKKSLSYIICAILSYFTYGMATERVVPMAFGADAQGANISDLVLTGGSGIGAIIAFIAAQFLGIKPELIQAVINFEKDRNNGEYQRRLGSAIISYMVVILKKYPDGVGGYLLYLINTIAQAVKESDPEIAKTLNVAANSIANVQFNGKDTDVKSNFIK